MSQGYRRDIDGLRAIAVLAVMLFHAGSSTLSGGFVGVDVFFVISGYLITRIVATEIDGDRFSLARFYARRVRRIIPALVCVVAVTTLLSFVVLTPGQLHHFGASVIATAVMAANVHFFLQSGYFAGPADQIPLLHTWSLSVEEQFYMLWPLFLAALSARMRRRRIVACAVLFAASLYASFWTAKAAPEAGFYLPFTRAWELLLGAFAAIGALPAPRSAAGAAAASVAGLAAVLGAAIAFSPATPFPGSAALFPTVGTLLILLAGVEQRPLVNRVLGWRPLVVLGLCSYSLYLWHWPFLVLAAMYRNRKLLVGERAVVLGVSVAASLLSWRYVETPFRRSVSSSDSIRRALIGGPVALAACCALGLGALYLPPWGIRNAERVTAAEAAGSRNNPLRRRCLVTSPTLPPASDCSFGADSSTAAASVLVWGDSHADALVDGIAHLASEQGSVGRQVTHVGCPPVLGVRVKNRPRCTRFNDAVKALIEGTPSLRAVVLVARWGLYAETSRPDTRRSFQLYESSGGTAKNATSAEVLADGLARTVNWLRERGVAVLIFADVPEFGFDPGVCVANELQRGGTEDHCTLERAKALEQLASTRPIFDEIVRQHPEVEVIWPMNAFCDARRCLPFRNDVVLYSDDDHVNVDGARYLSQLASGWFQRALH